MLAALATVKPSEKKKSAPTKPKSAPTKPKSVPSARKRPRPHDDQKMEYSKFVPLPPEENAPEPAIVLDIAYDAEELDPEPEEVDEWHAAMQAAEDEFESETVGTDRTDVGMSLEEDFQMSGDDDPYFEASSPPQPAFKRVQKPDRVRTYHGAPLEFDDEFVP